MPCEVGTSRKHNKTAGTAVYIVNMVGVPGFEPGASCAQGKHATKLRHTPKPV